MNVGNTLSNKNTSNKYPAIFGTVDGRNPAPPWDVKHHVNNRINYQPQLVTAGFLNHQQYQEVFLLRAPNLFFKVVRKNRVVIIWHQSKIHALITHRIHGTGILPSKSTKWLIVVFFPDGCLYKYIPWHPGSPNVRWWGPRCTITETKRIVFRFHYSEGEPGSQRYQWGSERCSSSDFFEVCIWDD